MKIALKTPSDTRWSSKYNAVNLLYCQFGEVVKALREISTNITFGNVVASAESILKELDVQLVFFFFLIMWNKLLNQNTRVFKVLQSSTIFIIGQASIMFISLNIFLREMRDSGGTEEIKTQANSIIKSELKIKRKIKIKTTSGGRSSNEDLSADQLLISVHCKFLDSMAAEIKRCFEKCSFISYDFEFLSGQLLSKTPVEEMCS